MKKYLVLRRLGVFVIIQHLSLPARLAGDPVASKVIN
jgi:hypothetical protein